MRLRRALINNQTYLLSEERNASDRENERKDWLDVLRALAVLFVIYGHLYKQYEFFLFTSPVKIPLFFAISGYLMYGKKESVKGFFQRMLRRIIIPWLVLSLGLGMRYILTQGIKFYLNYTVEVLIGKQLWYIVCCIIAQSIFYFLSRFWGAGWKLCIAVFLTAMVGLVLSSFGIGEMFQFNTALIAQFFLLLGYWIGKYENKLFNVKWWLPFVMLGVYVCLAIGSMVLFPGRTMDIHNNAYYNVPYCFLLITVGCVMIFVCVQPIKQFPQWLCAIGRNTLVFYIHNVFWKGMAARFLSLLRITIPHTWYGALIWLFLSCIGCGFEAYLLNRYFPEANGRKRKEAIRKEHKWCW